MVAIDSIERIIALKRWRQVAEVKKEQRYYNRAQAADHHPAQHTRIPGLLRTAAQGSLLITFLGISI
jgi:hypothetical protein